MVYRSVTGLDCAWNVDRKDWGCLLSTYKETLEGIKQDTVSIAVKDIDLGVGTVESHFSWGNTSYSRLNDNVSCEIIGKDRIKCVIYKE